MISSLRSSSIGRAQFASLKLILKTKINTFSLKTNNMTEQDIEMMATTYYKTFKVAQLRNILDNVGLPSSGKKADLIERLVQAIDGHWQIEKRKHYKFFVGVLSPIHTVYIYKTHDWFFTMLVEKQESHNYILEQSDKRGKPLSTQVVTKSKFNETVLSWRKDIEQKISEMMA